MNNDVTLIHAAFWWNETQRLRHFADWSPNSPEFHILREVQRGFTDTFLEINQDEHQFGNLTIFLQKVPYVL